MKNTNPIAATAVLIAWMTPLVVLAVMVFPPALLVVPAIGIIAGHGRRSKRKARAAALAAEEDYMRACWARWRALPRQP